MPPQFSLSSPFKAEETFRSWVVSTGITKEKGVCNRPRWCKVDLPDISEVEEWLQLPASTATCEASVCAPLMGDSRFYPDGLPKVFAYLRFSSDLKRSRNLKAKISQKKAAHTLPYPILGWKAYKTSADLKRDWPRLRCLSGL